MVVQTLYILATSSTDNFERFNAKILTIYYNEF
jgi:hypothetical protein